MSADTKLESWCSDRVEALAQALEPVLGPLQGPLQVARCGGGQSNPSYRIACASRQWLLRKKPQGPLLPSAHAVEREFRVIVREVNQPVSLREVPAVHAVEEGRLF